MPIAENKTATRLIIPKDLKIALEQIARQQNRSLNNLMATILQDYVNEKNQNETLQSENNK